MRVVALLRGINIGSHKRISMPVLREIVAGLGHADVETYLQSGNVVFTPGARCTPSLEDELAVAIGEATGFEVSVVVRTGGELIEVVAACPYAADDPTRLVVVFLGAEVDEATLGLGNLDAYAPDELTVSGKHAYASLPNGQGRSKLMEALARRQLPTVVTVRNWRTVMALAELTR